MNECKKEKKGRDFNVVYCDNWLNNNLPDKCAKLLIADPPYFEVEGEFDFIWKSFDDYLKDVEKWAIECKRVLADNGTLFWWGMDRKIAYSQIILDKYFNLVSTPVWEKPSNANEWDTRTSFPERAAERLLMYSSKNEQDAFKNIMEYFNIERKKIGWNYIQCDDFLNIKASYCYWDKPTTHDYVMCSKENYMKLQTTGYWQKDYDIIRAEFLKAKRVFDNKFKLNDVLRFSRANNNYDHDTKKPEKLTRALILTCSRPNDLVVVPFAGSGTECAMSAKEGRNFIGFDIEQKHVDTSNRRCFEILRQPQLF